MPSTSRGHTLLRPTSSSLPIPPLVLIFIPLLCVRLTGALYSTISDCDETYNYWEALHLILFGGDETTPFKTWEYDPRFAIRSWAYVLVHVLPAWIVRRVLGWNGKLVAFYTIRSSLAILSAVVETRFISTVTRVINARCGWFLLLIMLCNAGMWSASVALLPSSFTMYTTTLALSYALEPARSAVSPRNTALPQSSPSRTLKATCAFALGALLGWPFAIVLAGPFVLEEIFLASGNLVRKDSNVSFIVSRALGFLKASLIASLIAIPILLIDSLFYGKTVLVPLNIIVYNILSSKRGAGPELYGVEPPWFYLANLALNVGPIVLLLALSSLPLLAFVRIIDSRRVAQAATPQKGHEQSALAASSSLALLAMRILPFYIWLTLLSAQPHKEERFMFPAYTALCFNAALALELGIGLVEKTVFALARKLSTGSRAASPSPLVQALLSLPNLAALAVLIPSAIFSLLRVVGTLHAYHAPFTTLQHVNDHARTIRNAFINQQQPVFMDDLYRIDDPTEPQKINVCYGKEWYRFPNSFFLPEGFQGQFIKSEFSGILPKHFPVEEAESQPHALDSTLGRLFPTSLLSTTRTSEVTFNDMNLEELDRYVDPREDCHILVDSDPYPGTSSSRPAMLEPYYARQTKHWDTLTCEPFMDSEASKSVRVGNKVIKTLARVLYFPQRERYTAWRRFCVLVNKGKVVGARSSEDDDAQGEEKYIRESFQHAEL